MRDNPFDRPAAALAGIGREMLTARIPTGPSVRFEISNIKKISGANRPHWIWQPLRARIRIMPFATNNDMVACWINNALFVRREQWHKAMPIHFLGSGDAGGFQKGWCKID